MGNEINIIEFNEMRQSGGKYIERKEGNEKEWRGGKWDGVKWTTIR